MNYALIDCGETILFIRRGERGHRLVSENIFSYQFGLAYQSTLTLSFSALRLSAASTVDSAPHVQRTTATFRSVRVCRANGQDDACKSRLTYLFGYSDLLFVQQKASLPQQAPFRGSSAAKWSIFDLLGHCLCTRVWTFVAMSLALHGSLYNST